MSDLDQILSMTSDAIAVGVVTDRWESVDTKEKIINLMLRIIDDTFADSELEDPAILELKQELEFRIRDL